MDNYLFIRNEIDMLQGNINRMAVTDDEKELKIMREYAELRIKRIFQLRARELENGSKSGG